MCVSLGGFLGYQQTGWLIHAEAVPSEKQHVYLEDRPIPPHLGNQGPMLFARIGLLFSGIARDLRCANLVSLAISNPKMNAFL